MSSLQPKITKVYPLGGPTKGGTDVTISGSHLVTDVSTTVFFGNKKSKEIWWDGSSLHAISPPNSMGAAWVRVRTANGISQEPFWFLYGNFPPIVHDIEPLRGSSSGGNLVSITGAYFLTVTDVRFGPTPATSFAVLSDTQIYAVAPAAVTEGPVGLTLTNASGTSDSITYNYVTLAVPTVTGVSPASGPSVGGNTVVITGSGFRYATQVDFGGSTAASFSITSDTSIAAKAPPHESGMVSVTVSGPGGNSVVGAQYTYNAGPLPSIDTLTPSSGPLSGGNTTILTGANFDTVTAITFNSIPVLHFTVLSPTNINVTVPAAAAAGPVSVTVSAGAFTSASSTYTYIAAPAPLSISPTTGIVSGGTPITIQGTGLTGTSSLIFGTTAAPPASIRVVNDTEIDAITLAHAIGTVPVTVTTPGGTDTSLAFSFQLPPVIISISPTDGPVTGGTTVTINGAGLVNASGVYFGAQPATSYTVVSDNLITAVSPTGTGPGLVSVTVSSAAAFSNSQAFQYVAAPNLTSLDPISGSSLGGNRVTLTKSAFTGAQNVFFGDTAASFTVLDENTISATAPNVGVAGPVAVTVQNAGGTSGGLTYTYT